MAGGISDFPTFANLSSNAQTSAYAFVIDIPDDEKIPSPSSDTINTSFKNFHDKNPGWFTGSSIRQIDDIDVSPDSSPMNFRYISTPDTTLALCYGYDERNPDASPINGLTRVKNMLTAVSDHVIFKTNGDATAKSFLDQLKNGIENYRYCIFFEFSHGSKGYITLKGGLKRDDILEVLKNARNRIFGIFDSCHSQSMITYDTVNEQFKYMNCGYSDNYKITPDGWDKRGSNPTFKSAAENEPNIIDSLIDSLENEFKDGVPNTTFGHAPTVETSDKPIIMLWSSTGADNYGWYYQCSDTVLCQALGTAWDSYKNERYVMKGENEGLWPKTQSAGTSHWSSS